MIRIAILIVDWNEKTDCAVFQCSSCTQPCLHVRRMNNLPGNFFSSTNLAPPQSLALAFVVTDVRSADLSRQWIIFSISSLFAVMRAKLLLVHQRLKGLVHNPATQHRLTERGLMPGRHFMNGFLPGAHGAPQWFDSPAACLLAASDECLVEKSRMDSDHLGLSSVHLCACVLHSAAASTDDVGLVVCLNGIFKDDHHIWG